MGLGANRYGKRGIRLVKVERRAGWHDLLDLTVDVSLEGDFAAAYLTGDNSAVLPTDTMRGTVYALAAQGPLGEPEAFGLRLAGHFLQAAPAARVARVELAQAPWARIEAGEAGEAGAAPKHAFVAAGGGRRTATVTAATGDQPGAFVVAGVEDLVVLKTAGSAFEGFMRDRYTTLEATRDRILATAVTARWRYSTLEVDWAKAFERARRALLETFATHDSQSVQHSLHAMGQAALDAVPEVAEVRLVMPNRHHLLADLAPYGLENHNEVFVATDRPFGLIEGTVRRDGAGAPAAELAWG